MRRRDLLLSLAAGTVGALLDPRRALVDSAQRLRGRRADVLIIDDPPITDQPGHWTYTIPGGGVYDSRLDRFRCWIPKAP